MVLGAETGDGRARGPPGRHAAVTRVLVCVRAPEGGRRGLRPGRGAHGSEDLTGGKEGGSPTGRPEPRRSCAGCSRLGRPRPAPSLCLPVPTSPQQEVTQALEGGPGGDPTESLKDVKSRRGHRGPRHEPACGGTLGDHCSAPGPRTGPARAASSLCPRFLGGPATGPRGLTADGCGRDGAAMPGPEAGDVLSLALRGVCRGLPGPRTARGCHVPGWALGDVGSLARRS